MPFQLPQFIEREPKVIGPFTFRQFIPIGIAGVVLFFIYFSAPGWFAPLCVILGGIAVAFSFVKIQGQDLATVIKNFFFFSASPKLYLWKKKDIMPRLIKEKRGPAPAEKPEEKSPTLKITERGHLQKLSTEVETRTK